MGGLVCVAGCLLAFAKKRLRSDRKAPTGTLEWPLHVGNSTIFAGIARKGGSRQRKSAPCFARERPTYVLANPREDDFLPR